MPDTGQTTCYDGSGTVISCPDSGDPFYGQDAQYEINLPSYTKLDGTGTPLPDGAMDWAMVQDNVTGLIWEVKNASNGVKDYANPNDADNTYAWYDGSTGTPETDTDTLDFLALLNTTTFGGFSDWRLPTSRELAMLVHKGTVNPAIHTDYFPNTKVGDYWTSTSDAVSGNNAWRVFFYDGQLYGAYKGNRTYVRAVRGSYALGNFVDHEDNTVTDNDTGLTWEVKTDDGGPRDKDNTYTWEAALDYCEDLSLGGHDDWRLPNYNELMSILDPSEASPAIDTMFFPNTSASNYRCSTTKHDNTSHAWFVGFANGFVNSNTKSTTFSVRAVRGGLDPKTKTVEVTKAGSGSGTVTSSPAGIDCGSTCSAPFSLGTNLTLSAVADAGSSFEGWSGSCSGTDDCVFSVMDDAEVTATLTKNILTPGIYPLILD